MPHVSCKFFFFYSSFCHLFSTVTVQIHCLQSDSICVYVDPNNQFVIGVVAQSELKKKVTYSNHVNRNELAISD